MIAWASAGRQNGHLPPWKLGFRTKYFWKNLKSASWFRLIWFLQWQFTYRYETHTAQESGSQLQYSVMLWWALLFTYLPWWALLFTYLPSLQFNHAPSFACRGGLRKSRVDCSTVGLHCVTIKWQQIRKGSLYITAASVLLHETVERTHRGR